MSQTTVVKVKVEELSKYGFKANGRYVNYSKQLSEADKAAVVPGAEFEAEYFVADSGKEYLNKVLSSVVASTQPKVAPSAPVDTERAKKYSPKAFTPKFTKTAAVDNTMSRADWDKKDARISRQGLIQASLIALAPVVSLEMLFSEAAKLAEQGLEFVNKK